MASEAHNQPPQPLHQKHHLGSGGHDHHHRGLVVIAATASLHHRATPITLDLFHTYNPSTNLELQEPYSLPLKFVQRRCLEETNMSRRNGPKLDLKLNLSPPRANNLRTESPTRSAALTLSPTSPPSSCVSSELNQDEAIRYSNSPEATSMLLVGCPRCLMYVMLAEEDPRCPKCKSSVLLDIVHENSTTAATTTTTTVAAATKKTRRS